MRVTLFTDLNCPFCYSTEQRLERLGVSGQIAWRGVEHEPELAAPMARGDLEIIAVPPGKANTAAGLLAVAAALRVDAGRGAAFRQVVYRAFWRDGLDISDPAVLDALADDVGLPPRRPRPEDTLTVASWRLEWERSPLRGVPLLVREDGETVYGLKDVETLERFVRAG